MVLLDALGQRFDVTGTDISGWPDLTHADDFGKRDFETNGRCQPLKLGLSRIDIVTRRLAAHIRTDKANPRRLFLPIDKRPRPGIAGLGLVVKFIHRRGQSLSLDCSGSKS